MFGLGTCFNVIGILLGSAIGRWTTWYPNPTQERACKVLLGVWTVLAGLSLTWKALAGSFRHFFVGLAITVLALLLGKIIGRLARLQRWSNQAGRIAKDRMAKLGTPGASPGDGFLTAALLFCVGPLGPLGAIQDGLAGNPGVLAIKAVVDGLAALSFTRMFGGGVALSALPVAAVQGTLTLVLIPLGPWLVEQDLLRSLNAVTGLLVFCVALIILELKRLEIADYLPSLAVAPLLAWLFR